MQLYFYIVMSMMTENLVTRIWWYPMATGGTKEVWTSCKLAEGVYNGGHTDATEKGDGGPT